MRVLRITTGPFTFEARLEEQKSPRTCAAIRAILPFDSKLIQARWSGEAAWVPMGDRDLGIARLESPTSEPAPGELLVYPGGISETEILFPYGTARFASVAGPLAGDHFATITTGREHLADLGKLVLWSGAQDLRIELAPST